LRNIPFLKESIEGRENSEAVYDSLANACVECAARVILWPMRGPNLVLGQLASDCAKALLPRVDIHAAQVRFDAGQPGP
jgi:hypothetical protein